MDLLVFSVLLFASAVSASGPHALPSCIKTCLRNDTNMSACMLNAVQEGIRCLADGNKDLDVKPLDPLRISKINLQQGNDGPVALSLDFEDIDVHGISQVTADSASGELLSGENKRIVLKFSMPDSLIINGKCNINGKILLLPIVGSGESQVDLIGPSASLVATGKIVKKSGVDYLIFTSFQFNLDVKGVKFHFANLFKGDKRIGENINAVLNENAMLLYADLKPAIEKTFANVIADVTNQVFTKVPFDKIFPLQ